MADLREKTVGILRGSRTARELELNPSRYGITARFYDDYEYQYSDLTRGLIQAFIADRLSARIWLADYRYSNQLRLAGTTQFTEDFAVAVKKGNSALLRQINAGPKSVIESGEAADIESRWIR